MKTAQSDATVQPGNTVKLLVTLTFLIMVTVNALANILPINGQGTGQVSDSYPNLFAPAGITFAIWGLIYLLLAGYTLYQLGLFRRDKSAGKIQLLTRTGVYFSISSIANAAWIFSWHYHLIPLSMVLMIIILLCLIAINQTIKQAPLSSGDRLFVRLPFSVYFGWITVATIANAVALLVSLDWNRLGLSETAWTAIIIAVGMLIGTATMLINRDVAYGLVLIWAYAGILAKHTSASGFAGKYPPVITAVIACLVLFVIAEAYLLFTSKKLKS
jgi:hypothetical protein